MNRSDLAATLQNGKAQGWTDVNLEDSSRDKPLEQLRMCEWALELDVLPLSTNSLYEGLYSMALVGNAAKEFPRITQALEELRAQRLAAIAPFKVFDFNDKGLSAFTYLWHCEWALTKNKPLTDQSKAHAIKHFAHVKFASQAFPKVAHYIGAGSGPAYMVNPPKRLSDRLTLLPQEEDLVFQEGDYYEVISGLLSVTQTYVVEAGSTRLAEGSVQSKFIFDSVNSRWGSREWLLTGTNHVQNGPSLLLLYVRGDYAYAFGVISMVNRSWTHAMPLTTIPIIENSQCNIQMKRGQRKGLAKTAGRALGKALLPGALGLFIGNNAPLDEFLQENERVASAVRLLMHRVAKEADQYWQASGGSTSGKL